MIKIKPRIPISKETILLFSKRSAGVKFSFVISVLAVGVSSVSFSKSFNTFKSTLPKPSLDFINILLRIGNVINSVITIKRRSEERRVGKKSKKQKGREYIKKKTNIKRA